MTSLTTLTMVSESKSKSGESRKDGKINGQRAENKGTGVKNGNDDDDGEEKCVTE
jgi:hypothetical protein